MEAITLVSLAFLVKKIVDTLKFATNKDVKSVVTQVVVWAAATLVVVLAANADLTASINFYGKALGDVNGASLVLGGLIFGSTASVIGDLGKQIDNSNSFITPSLIPDGENTK